MLHGIIKIELLRFPKLMAYLLEDPWMRNVRSQVFKYYGGNPFPGRIERTFLIVSNSPALVSAVINSDRLNTLLASSGSVSL